MNFEFLKIGRSDEDVPCFLISADTPTLELIKRSASYVVCHSQDYSEVREAVELVEAVAKTIDRGKIELDKK